MAATIKTELTPAKYAEDVYAGWHREDIICYTNSRGVFTHCPNRQTILYLPGRLGASSESRWISYEWADECRNDAERLKQEVATATTLEEAGAIVDRFFANA